MITRNLYQRLSWLSAVVVVVLTVFYLNGLKAHSQSAVGSSPAEIKWAQRIDEAGGAQAYAEYKQENANRPFDVQHNAAHLMGALLYEKLGLDGLTVCDSTFAFGCYHSFFAQALSHHGVSVIKRLDEVCTNAYGPYGTGCQHGIGHGLLEYFGHNQLAKALEACSLTTRISPLAGCSSGVFMEYNLPTVIGESTTVPQTRAIDFAKPYDPCPNMSDEYRSSCYYELAQWWTRENLFNGDYKKLGALCHEVAERQNREVCFLGVGNISAPSSDYAVEETIAKCQKMPVLEEQIICRAGASWSFFASPEHRELSPKLCEGLLPQSAYQCIRNLDLVGIPNI